MKVEMSSQPENTKRTPHHYYRVELANNIREGRNVGNLYGVAHLVNGCRQGWELKPQDDLKKAERVASHLNARKDTERSKMSNRPENKNVRLTFAGVSFKTTKNAQVRRPAYLKVLRSGKVSVFCDGSYTDDYAFDNANNFGRKTLSPEAVENLANSIENDPSGWWCSAWQKEDGTLSLGCHSFKSYTITDLSGENA